MKSGATGSAQARAESLLKIDAAAETEFIAREIRRIVQERLHRRGAVIGLSGGIDSTVSAALCVRALGAKRVFGIMMPEHDSSPESEQLGRVVADWLGIEAIVEDVAPALEGAGCYRRRDDAIRSVFPQYGPGYKCKLVIADGQSAGFAVSTIVVKAPDGTETRVRATADAYSQLVAATNFKQRTRKMIEYYHADRLRYAVVGTPNRLEYDQGFFVKNGDSAADFKPIAHLYKTQVYELAAYLGVPSEIINRPSTTDTFPLEQSQEEFFFSVPLATMDLCLYGVCNRIPAEELARSCELDEALVQSTYRSIQHRRRVTAYLHEAPVLIRDVAIETEGGAK